MGLYIISCIDRSGSLDLRMATRPKHLQFLAESSGVKVAGPFLDDDGNMVGSMLIVEVASLEDARNFAACDPYAQVGLFQSSDIRPWKQTAGTATL
ncbi:YciI family protein [Alteraurantiacibacter buctensis]|uniref:YciI family protein n=1 Tax=Alteraurantiacibacter buctensis TaxID=1503981 RepID=A0A844YTY7_9SPHN|nr:YciI family protein [Alteraurantiacibacter buctensis]MXO71785.1 YciI family protein [Alteraurantiacibacter buctensis]